MSAYVNWTPFEKQSGLGEISIQVRCFLVLSITGVRLDGLLPSFLLYLFERHDPRQQDPLLYPAKLRDSIDLLRSKLQTWIILRMAARDEYGFLVKECVDKLR